MRPLPQRSQRLFAAARRARAVPAESGPAPMPPPGFATRVVARWAANRPDDWLGVWDRVGTWGAVAAAAVCLAVFLWQRPPAAPAWADLVSAPASALEDFAP